MAHAYYHAKSSARRFGAEAEDYLALHEFMDHTKMHLADNRHRLFLHNAWGIFFAEKVLGRTLRRASDGKILPVRAILEQHVIEDLAFIPTLEYCFHELLHDPLLADEDDDLLHARRSVQLFDGVESDYHRLHRLLNSVRSVMADRRHQRVLHNAWGVTVLLRLLGTTLTRPSDGVTLSLRPILEAHICYDLGHVPTLEESVEGIALAPWMYRHSASLSQLDERRISYSYKI